ncbi:T9SS type A sorting domain-containing protein [Flavobacterium channae]|uniref:T9SS type A sorting domain-containing protein n=1 Tax=Flavobacterium channae TaxID=2897181 RepID=UPI001E588CB3|nr:T9SS type A sorting domain-containing protein [Flavobacterium channae]UGS24838.1 T9SS type A sorting domain-containing protein [Flavobacterium channae]
MKKTLLLFTLFSAFSFAQVNVNITGPITFGGASFGMLYDAGDLQGTLTSVTITATLTASVNETYADDLTIAVADGNSLSTANFLFQGGGYSNFGAPDRQSWPNGGSDVVGTVVSGTITLASGIDFTANPAYAIFLGNGYADAQTPTNSGTWSNISITLNGVTETPASASDFNSNSFTIYPNPVSNVLNISNSNNFDVKGISITDINGRVVKNQTGSLTQVNVADLNAGVYFVTIEASEGKTTKKFIKQ